MKKDAYYFSHDANAQDDPKLMKLMDDMGAEGYGIFWLLIEKLRAEKDYTLPLEILPIFAKRWGQKTENLQKVLKNYKLFKISSKNFYSVRLKNSMEEKTERAKASASVRWSNTIAMQPHSKRNAIGMRNDANKVKERKVKHQHFFPDGNNEQPLLKPGMVL